MDLLGPGFIETFKLLLLPPYHSLAQWTLISFWPQSQIDDAEELYLFQSENSFLDWLNLLNSKAQIEICAQTSKKAGYISLNCSDLFFTDFD